MAEPVQDRVQLLVAGRLYEGWTEVEVVKGVRDLAGAFTLQWRDRDAAGRPLPPIRRGDACEVRIASEDGGGETVISGFVDQARAELDADRRSLTVSGRDRAADLVDCSALHSPGRWRDRTLAQIAAELIAPFGLSVRVEGDAGPPFARFALQQGETVFEALERLVRFRGLMIKADRAGGVVLHRPGGRRAAFSLKEGVQPLRLSAVDDGADRFSLYVLKGQSAGSDALNGEAAAGPKAEARDPGVGRHRPLLVLAEAEATLANLAARAGWEANVRAAEGRSLEITVQGWRDPTGALWSADLVVAVEAPSVDVSGDWLIADVAFRLSEDEGSTTALSLSPPDAYRPEPISAAGAEAVR